MNYFPRLFYNNPDIIFNCESSINEDLATISVTFRVQISRGTDNTDTPTTETSKTTFTFEREKGSAEAVAKLLLSQFK